MRFGTNNVAQFYYNQAKALVAIFNGKVVATFVDIVPYIPPPNFLVDVSWLNSPAYNIPASNEVNANWGS